MIRNLAAKGVGPLVIYDASAEKAHGVRSALLQELKLPAEVCLCICVYIFIFICVSVYAYVCLLKENIILNTQSPPTNQQHHNNT